MTPRAPDRPRPSWRVLVALGAIAVAALLAFAALGSLVREPDVVPRLTVRNDTDQLVEVLVRDDDRALLPIAVVEPRRRGVAYDVIDQGDRWSFVVRVSGERVGRIELSRAQLARADWTLTVPNTGPDAPTG